LYEVILSVCPTEDIEQDITEVDEISVGITGMQSECERHLEIRKARGYDQTKQTNSEKAADTLCTDVACEQYAGAAPLTEHMSDMNELPPPLTAHVSDMNEPPPSSTQHASETVTKRMKPKLPKLILPRFSGDVTKFCSLWDSFKSAVDENDELAEVDKFNYLQSLLEGPAAKLIQGLQLSAPNYEQAKQVLEGHFGRTKQIISAHTDEF